MKYLGDTFQALQFSRGVSVELLHTVIEQYKRRQHKKEPERRQDNNDNRSRQHEESVEKSSKRYSQLRIF